MNEFAAEWYCVDNSSSQLCALDSIENFAILNVRRVGLMSDIEVKSWNSQHYIWAHATSKRYRCFGVVPKSFRYAFVVRCSTYLKLSRWTFGRSWYRLCSILMLHWINLMWYVANRNSIFVSIQRLIERNAPQLFRLRARISWEFSASTTIRDCHSMRIG